jgi:hypothetical protein
VSARENFGNLPRRDLREYSWPAMMKTSPDHRLHAKPTKKRLGAQLNRNRHGNPPWSEGIIVPVPTVSEFERTVARLKLKPDEYVDSCELREWAQANKDTRFVPERLLKAWGLSLRGSIDDIG